MYFPYLRGKQFELIAIRELCDKFSDEFQKKISPVIEPVKTSSTLKSTLKELSFKEVNFSIVINPFVGDLKHRYQDIIDILEDYIPEYENYQIAIILDPNTEQSLSDLIECIGSSDLKYKGISLIHKFDFPKRLIDVVMSSLNVIYNFIYFSRTSRRYNQEFDLKTTVSLDDYFKYKKRSVDYSDEESIFSEEYRYYEEDGFAGFSDFLTIGDVYSESGFLPRAVVIHLSFVDKEEKFKIRHFVSDSNEDISDVAGKFSEAVSKLVKWCDSNAINTEAVKIFAELHKTGKFPGLGTIKKLSIMNHIEVVIKHIKL